MLVLIEIGTIFIAFENWVAPNVEARGGPKNRKSKQCKCCLFKSNYHDELMKGKRASDLMVSN